jgi:hypothetical protein
MPVGYRHGVAPHALLKMLHSVCYTITAYGAIEIAFYHYPPPSKKYGYRDERARASITLKKKACKRNTFHQKSFGMQTYHI